MSGNGFGNGFSSSLGPDGFGSGFYAPSGGLVSTGLILHYDIGNTTSYPGSGATVTDLRDNSAASLANSPSYADGYLTFNGVDQALKTNTALDSQFPGSPPADEITSVFLWMYPMGGGNILVERGTSSYTDTTWFDSNIDITAGGQFKFSVWHGLIPYTAVVTSAAQSFNKWYYVGWTYNGSVLNAYINGSSVGTVSLNRDAPYNNGTSLFYSIAGPTATNTGVTGYCNMRLGQFQVYNVALTAADVAQNFRAGQRTYGV